MKKKKLITLGCSWTGRYDNKIDPVPDPWPTVIEKKTGWDVVNCGVNGSGNYYAFSCFLEQLRIDPDIDAVYWLMSEFDRLDTTPNTEYRNKHAPVITYKRILFGLNPEAKLEGMRRNYLRSNPNATEEQLEAHEKHIQGNVSVCVDLMEVMDIQQVIDENLFLIRQMQHLCKKRNIELKVAAALRPIEEAFFKHNKYNVPEMILKSKHSKNLDLSNILGWPFYKRAGGVTGNTIRDWGKLYGLSPSDNHPGQEGANLLADIFLGEKNILDYR